jgi:predicted nucleic acid-binding protein
MTAFLLDTNVLSEIIKPKPSAEVELFMAREGDLWLSVIALHELAYGVARVTDAIRRLKLQTWVEAIRIQFRDRILPVDAAIAETAGRFRAFCAFHGRSLEPLDSLIAATATVHAKVLATRNIRDFDTLGVDLRNPWEG